MVVLEAIIDFENQEAGERTYAINPALEMQHRIKGTGVWCPEVSNLSEIDEERAATDNELFGVHVLINERGRKFTFSIYPLIEEPKQKIPTEHSYIDDDGARVTISGWDSQGYDERGFIVPENKIAEFDIKLHQFREDWELYLGYIQGMAASNPNGPSSIMMSEFKRTQMHDALSSKMSDELARNGLHNVGMRHFVEMLREYHALLPHLVREGSVTLKSGLRL